jgi:hypothetical protein
MNPETDCNQFDYDITVMSDAMPATEKPAPVPDKPCARPAVGALVA